MPMHARLFRSQAFYLAYHSGEEIVISALLSVLLAFSLVIGAEQEVTIQPGFINF